MITQEQIRKMHRALVKLNIPHNFVDDAGTTFINFRIPYELGGELKLYYFPFQGLCALNDGSVTYSKNYEGRLVGLQRFKEIMDAVKAEK